MSGVPAAGKGLLGAKKARPHPHFKYMHTHTAVCVCGLFHRNWYLYIRCRSKCLLNPAKEIYLLALSSKLQSDFRYHVPFHHNYEMMIDFRYNA